MGWGVATLLDQDYTVTDAAIDFGLGFATTGLSNIGKLRHMTGARAFVTRAATEVSLDVSSEYVRCGLNGRTCRARDLAQGALANFGIGEAGSILGLGLGRLAMRHQGYNRLHQRLTRDIKGDIGEALTRLEYGLRGWEEVATQVTMREVVRDKSGKILYDKGARAKWDHVMRHQRSGELRVVESKFGPGALMGRGQPRVADYLSLHGEAIIRGRSSVQQMREIGFSGGSFRRGMHVTGLGFAEQRFTTLEKLFTMFLF